MKKILFIAALAFSLSASAQTYHIDTAGERFYAAIEPLELSYLQGNPSVTRLYLQFTTPFVPTLTASFIWGLYYPREIDSVTTTWIQLIGGNVHISSPGNLTGAQAIIGAMRYIRDSATYNGERPNIIFE